MSFSNLGEFSDGQALVATTDSTNYVDMAIAFPGIGAGVPIYIAIRVGAAFTVATSYSFDLENDDNGSFTSAVVFPLRNAIAIVSLTAGAWVYRSTIPYEVTERYIQLVYTEIGSTESTGTIDAFLSLKPPTDYDANSQVWKSNVGNP